MKVATAGRKLIRQVVNGLDREALHYLCAARRDSDRKRLVWEISHMPADVFAIMEGDTAVALAMFTRISPTTAEFTFTATPAWRPARSLRWWLRDGRGFLAELGIRRLEVRLDVAHAEAISLLQRLGFVGEAVLPLFGRDGSTHVLMAWRDMPAATIDAHTPRLSFILRPVRERKPCQPT